MADADEQFLAATLPHLDAVHALAVSCARQRADVEDLVQETWLRAYRSWDRTRPVDVRAWLVTICLNLCRSDGRRRSARPEVLQAEPGERRQAPDDPASAVLSRADADAVHAALRLLPAAHREAVALVDLAGLTTAQAAVVVGRPRGTVLSHVHRGRTGLARRLRAAGHAPEQNGRTGGRPAAATDGSR